MDISLDISPRKGRVRVTGTFAFHVFGMGLVSLFVIIVSFIYRITPVITNDATFIYDDHNVLDPNMSLVSQERKFISMSQYGEFFEHHFLNLMKSRKRITTKNPCYPHTPADNIQQPVFCLPEFYILGPQKCGTTDTFERIMRHPNVVRLNPKQGEKLEPQLWTNQIEESVNNVNSNGKSLLFRFSSSQYSHHMKELLGESSIAGDASASLMYRVAVPDVPTPIILHAIQPQAKLIAVLRDPVERTYSDFRYFFHCGGKKAEYDICPSWWTFFKGTGIDPASRFHEIVQLEINEFELCLKHGFDHQKTPNELFKTMSSKMSKGARHNNVPLNSKLSSLPIHHNVELFQNNSSMSLLYKNSISLNFCKRRPDLNRDAYLNKCSSGRVVLSLYAAFLVDWLLHFSGHQLLALPLEGLDKSPYDWIGGIYNFLKLKQPNTMDWRMIVPPTIKSSDIKRKTANVVDCHGSIAKFGPMKSETKLLLRKFFTPWNDALRLLLLENKVATVPGFPIERSTPSDLVRKSSSSSSSPPPPPPPPSPPLFEDQFEPPELFDESLSAAYIDPMHRGLWWWDYSVDSYQIQPVRDSVHYGPKDKNQESEITLGPSVNSTLNNNQRIHPTRTITRARGAHIKGVRRRKSTPTSASKIKAKPNQS